MKIKKIFLITISILLVVFSVNANENQSYNITYNFSNEIYVAPYVGDIDGSVSEKRFEFYMMLAKFHTENDIPVGMSFYPGTLEEDPEFIKPFTLMYYDKDIELIQKGYMGDDKEGHMAELSENEQRDIMKNGQWAFKDFMEKITGDDEIYLPQSYNQIMGSFTDKSAKVAKSVGFEQYFDVFVAAGYEPAKTTDDFISIQYGVSYLNNSRVLGPDSSFRSADTIIKLVDNYSREDINITYIDGKPVVPLWVHQQDFSDPNSKDYYNHEKWDIYKKTLLYLKTQPNVKLINPAYVHTKLLRENNNDNSTNNDEMITQEPLYTDIYSRTEKYLEREDASIICREFELPYFEKKFSFENGCKWLNKNAGFGLNLGKSIIKDGENKTTITYQFEDTLVNASLEMKSEDNIEIEKLLIVNPTTNEEKEINFSIENKSIITKIPNNFGVHKVIIELSEKKPNINITPILKGDYPNIKSKENVEPCRWKECNRGAVSISVDDYFTACMNKLEEQGFRGTYYLANTNNKISDELWNKFNEAFKKGHDIGTHTRTHWCIDIGEEKYRKDINNNIADIVNNTDMKREDIVSHSQPCGFTNKRIQTILKENGYLSARGYNINELETSNPDNKFDLKSVNDIGYPGGKLNPEDYYVLLNKTQKQNRWVNMVFHSYCNDKDVIEEFARREVWVDTVANVMRYDYLRNNIEINYYDYDSEEKTITFRTNIDKEYEDPRYKQNVSLKLNTQWKNVDSVKVNDKEVTYKWIRDDAGYYVVFDVPFPIEGNDVEVKFK